MVVITTDVFISRSFLHYTFHVRAFVRNIGLQN
jgi:hypothetical protein